MSRPVFILTILGIFLAEQWLLAIFNWQLRANLLAMFVLTVAFLDRHFEDKLGWAVLLLLVLEFKTGGSWGLFPLALLLTLLFTSGISKVLTWPVNNLWLSAGWIFMWYYFFMGLYLGLEVVMNGGYAEIGGPLQNSWAIVSGNMWIETMTAALAFVVYFRLVKMRL